MSSRTFHFKDLCITFFPQSKKPLLPPRKITDKYSFLQTTLAGAHSAVTVGHSYRQVGPNRNA
jgi:hypothetical protein